MLLKLDNYSKLNNKNILLKKCDRKEYRIIVFLLKIDTKTFFFN